MGGRVQSWGSKEGWFVRCIAGRCIDHLVSLFTLEPIRASTVRREMLPVIVKVVPSQCYSGSRNQHAGAP